MDNQFFEVHFAKWPSPILAAVLLVALTAMGCVEDRSAASDAKNDVGARVLDDGGTESDGSLAGCRPNTEICDGADNDCDGKTDEGFSIGESCSVEVGECVSDGIWACNGENGTAMCQAAAPEQVPEICDGTDNDCDGTIDETFDTATDVAHCGGCDQACLPTNAVPRCIDSTCVIGRCEPGFQDVNLDPADGCECQYQNERQEACNGVDDDCDGQVDEGFGLGNVCQVGVGACANDGAVACDDMGGTRCTGEPSPPMAEICNGFDDDCDGGQDEGFDRDGDGAYLCPDLDCDAPCPDGIDCATLCALRDCNDDDPSIGPLGREVCQDGIDQNCDGVDAPCAVHSGRIFEFSIVAAGQPGCRDLDGDGNPDNAFGALAGLINPQISGEIAGGNLNLFALIYGLETSDVVARFEMAVVYAVNGRVAPDS